MQKAAATTAAGLHQWLSLQRGSSLPFVALPSLVSMSTSYFASHFHGQCELCESDQAEIFNCIRFSLMNCPDVVNTHVKHEKKVMEGVRRVQGDNPCVISEISHQREIVSFPQCEFACLSGIVLVSSLSGCINLVPQTNLLKTILKGRRH